MSNKISKTDDGTYSVHSEDGRTVEAGGQVLAGFEKEADARKAAESVGVDVPRQGAGSRKR
jgi:hypothetical protein